MKRLRLFILSSEYYREAFYVRHVRGGTDKEKRVRFDCPHDEAGQAQRRLGVKVFNSIVDDNVVVAFYVGKQYDIFHIRPLEENTRPTDVYAEFLKVSATSNWEGVGERRPAQLVEEFKQRLLGTSTPTTTPTTESRVISAVPRQKAEPIRPLLEDEPEKVLAPPPAPPQPPPPPPAPTPTPNAAAPAPQKQPPSNPGAKRPRKDPYAWVKEAINSGKKTPMKKAKRPMTGIW